MLSGHSNFGEEESFPRRPTVRFKERVNGSIFEWRSENRMRIVVQATEGKWDGCGGKNSRTLALPGGAIVPKGLTWKRTGGDKAAGNYGVLPGGITESHQFR